MSECYLCDKGFLLEGIYHIPTQQKGMIPVTPCIIKLQEKISTLEEKVKELESKENGLKHFIQHELKQISPRLETKLEQAEARIKELEQDGSLNR